MDMHKGKYKIILIFAIFFIIVSTLLALIFYAGKKSHNVRFDINGGTLLGGSLEQSVIQGQDAVPPTVVKEGAYLRGWSGSYTKVTKDVVVQAIWEYTTTPGIIYSSGNQNYAEISGAYKYINGEIYLGAYYGDKIILGIRPEAFANCEGITKIYLLDGLLSIGANAFSGCTSLTEIEIPKTVTHLEDGVFRYCEDLEKIVLQEGLLKIGDVAFEGCTSLTEIEVPKTVTKIGDGIFRGCEKLETVVLSEELLEIGEGAFEDCIALKEIVLPSTIQTISSNAFAGCDNLIINMDITSAEAPEAWAEDWFGSATVIWSDGEKYETKTPDTDDTQSPEDDGDTQTPDAND